MEITMTTGARYFPQIGLLAAPGEVWSERVRTAPALARRPRAVGSSCAGRSLAGRPFYRAFYGSPINSIGIDMPTATTCPTDRMRASASEP